jgi:hypothetical protein
MATTETSDLVTTETPPIFASVLCGIDGSRSDAEIARQAAVITGSTGSLEFIAITSEIGVGLSAQAQFGHEHARQALNRAHEVARNLGVRSTERSI